MPMVMSVAVVVAQHPAVIRSANTRVDVRQAILHHLGPALGNLLFHNRPSPFARQMTNVDRRSDRHGVLGLPPHRVILSQIGHRMSALYPPPLAIPPNLRHNKSLPRSHRTLPEQGYKTCVNDPSGAPRCAQTTALSHCGN